MIDIYNGVTEGLTKTEEKTILPRVVELLKRRWGKENAVTNRHIIMLLKAMGHEVTAPRIRKMINQIRNQGLVNNLLATSKGYYVGRDKKEINEYINSLRERAAAINKIADVLEHNN